MADLIHLVLEAEVGHPILAHILEGQPRLQQIIFPHRPELAVDSEVQVRLIYQDLERSFLPGVYEQANAGGRQEGKSNTGG